MIALLSPTFDLDGRLVIPFVKPDPNRITRRVTRVATLDGGAAFNDFGYSDADRTLEYTFPTRSLAQLNAVRRLMEQYPLLRVCAIDGVWLAAPSAFKPGAKESTLTLLAKEKLSA